LNPKEIEEKQEDSIVAEQEEKEDSTVDVSIYEDRIAQLEVSPTLFDFVWSLNQRGGMTG